MNSEADLPKRTVRVPIEGDIALRRSCDIRYKVKIRDLSPEGCRVELVERVRPGDRLFISLPGLATVEATACWVDEFVAGVKFVSPLHASVFDMLSARFKLGEQ